MYIPPNPFDHNNSQVGNHSHDPSHQQIAAEYLDSQKREMRLGSQNCKNIEALMSLSHIASLLAKKIESNHTLISKPYKMNIEIGKLSKKIDCLEADFFEYQF
jgi:hypothetical protein